MSFMELDFDPKYNITTGDYVRMCMGIGRLTYKVKDLLIIRKIVKNWPSVLLFRLGLKKNVTMHFRDGKCIKVNSLKAYFDFWNKRDGMCELLNIFKHEIKKNIITFNYKNSEVKLWFDSAHQLVNTGAMIVEQFAKEGYKWLDVRNKIVIDVGANIGDSAVYFILMGAKHVYAFEPYPYSYEIAKRNCKVNLLR